MERSPEQLDAFVLHVLASPVLQLALQRHQDHHDFPQVVMRMGHEHGFRFIEEDVRDAQRTAQRVWLHQETT